MARVLEEGTTWILYRDGDNGWDWETGWCFEGQRKVRDTLERMVL